MKTNLLYEIYNNKLSINEAYELFEKTISSKKAKNVKEILGFSDIEYTAFAGQGVPLDIASKFRYEGWPRRCKNCNRDIILEKFGWNICGSGNNQKDYFIVHITCPES